MDGEVLNLIVGALAAAGGTGGAGYFTFRSVINARIRRVEEEVSAVHSMATENQKASIENAAVLREGKRAFEALDKKVASIEDDLKTLPRIAASLERVEEDVREIRRAQRGDTGPGEL